MKKQFSKFLAFTLAMIIAMGTFNFSPAFAASGDKEDVNLLAHQNWDFKLYNNFEKFKDSSFVKDSDYTTDDDMTLKTVKDSGYQSSTAIITTINSNGNQSDLITPTEGKGFKSDFTGAKEFWVWVDLSGLTKEFRKAFFGFTTTDGKTYQTDDMDDISNMPFYIQGSGGNWQEKHFDTDGCMEGLGNYKGFIRFSTDFFVSGSATGEKLDLSKIKDFKVWYDLSDSTGGEGSTFVIDHVGFAGPTMTDTDGKVSDLASNGTLVLPSTLPKQTFDESSVKLRYGAVSDIHISADTGDAADKAKSAFTQLKAKAGGNLDAVLAVGDLTDYGKDEQAKSLKNIVTSNLDLSKTKFVAALGNHDYYNHSINKAPDEGGNLIKQYFGDSIYQGATAAEVQAGDYHTTINGYDFIVVNCAQYDGGVKYSQTDIDWLKTQLANAQTAHPAQPIFVASHPTITDTTWAGNHAGDYYNSTDLYSVLKDYPQSIYFSGHTHYSLNDEKDIWQGDFTTVGTASVYYGCVDTYASDNTKYYGVTGDDPTDYDQFSQGLYVEVDKDNNVKLTRMDFYHQKEIKTAWIIPAPTNPTHLQYYSTARKLDNKAPSYYEDATAAVVAKDVDKGTTTVEFSKANDDDMVSSYLVQFVDKTNNKVIKSIRVYSDFYEYPQVGDMPEKLTFKFPSGTTAPFTPDYVNEYSVRVTAVDSWDATSTPIESETYAGTPVDPSKPVVKAGAELHNDWNFKLFNNFNTYKPGYKLQSDVDYNSWPEPDDDAAAKPEPIALNGYKSTAAVTTKIYSAATHFTIYFPTGGHKYKSDFTGAKEFWVWADFSNVKFRKLFFGLKEHGAYGDEYSTDDFDGQSDMKAYIQDGSGGWKEVSFDNDGCLEQFGNYKGFIRFPLEYMKKGEDTLYPDDIQCFKLWFSPANADCIGKTFTFDDVGFAGPDMTDADGTIQQLLDPNTPDDIKTQSASKAIKSFSIGGAAGVINETSHTIAVTVPYGTDVKALTPTVAVSQNATVSPVSGAAQDFTNPVTYTVTAEDKTTQEYKVTVTAAASQNSDNGSSNHHSSSNPPASPNTPSPVTTSANPTGGTTTTVTPTADTAPVVTGNRANIAVTVPAEVSAAVTSATAQNPTHVQITSPTASILAQLQNSAVQTVDTSITVPPAVANNTNANATVSITAEQTVLQAAKDAKKDVTLEVINSETGKLVYSWTFKGAELASAATVKPIDLAISVHTTAEVAAVGAATTAANKGLVLSFSSSNGVLPSNAAIKMNVADKGYKSGETLYFYYYNPTTKALEPVGNTMYTVDKDGYVSVNISHCSDYVLLPKQVRSITLDTFSYTTAPKKSYEIGVKQAGAKDTTVKVYSSNNGVATVTMLKNGNYKVTGKSVGTAYIMFDVYDKKSKKLTHASVRINVEKGVKPFGSSARQIGIY